ncbi:MAG: response regulator [Bacteriovoracaceae bacterium]|jgi:PAS domain S-box-containing protein|nr:response regulator [Bacteriovoracaceae bacterium]
MSNHFIKQFGEFLTKKFELSKKHNGELLDILGKLKKATVVEYIDTVEKYAKKKGISPKLLTKNVFEEFIQVFESRQTSLDRALKLAKIGSWEYHLDDKTLNWSEDLYKIFEQNQDEFEPTIENFFELVHPDDSFQFKEKFNDLIEFGTPFAIEFKIQSPDGKNRYFRSECILDENEKKQSSVIRGIVQDISDKKRAENLSINFARVMDECFQEIYIIDASNFDIIQFNREARKSLNYTISELFKMNFADLVNEYNEKEFGSRLKPLKEYKFDRVTLLLDLKNKDGTIYPVEASFQYTNFGEKPCFMIMAVNVAEKQRIETEKDKLEDQLRQSQKMETIGTLSGGIAHDFNNILTPILMSSERLMRSLEPSSKEFQSAKRIRNSSMRAKDLVQKILSFSRKNLSDKQYISVNEILEEVLSLIRSTLPTTITVVEQIPTEQAIVYADKTQLHQVFMNLCTNAFHAMKDSGGRLTVKIEGFAPPDIHNGELSKSPDGLYSSIKITDSGVGMSDQVISKIFDPFFTTKKVGEGTGLGLSVTHGIISDHGGVINVLSTEGKGTTFDIVLPTFNETVITPDEDELDFEASGEGSILWVDDEFDISEIGRDMLEEKGFKVLSMTSSSQALNIITRFPKKFDLIITDQTMPELTGTQLMEKVLSINPELPFLLVSGFSKKQINSEKTPNLKGFITKPFSSKELFESVMRLIDQKNQMAS